MSNSNLCRLCLNPCSSRSRNLYDKDGLRTEAYELLANYFTPELLQKECGKHLTRVCFKCWSYIEEFRGFQQSVLFKQTQLEASWSVEMAKTSMGTLEKPVALSRVVFDSVQTTANEVSIKSETDPEDVNEILVQGRETCTSHQVFINEMEEVMVETSSEVSDESSNCEESQQSMRRFMGGEFNNEIKEFPSTYPPQNNPRLVMGKTFKRKLSKDTSRTLCDRLTSDIGELQQQLVTKVNNNNFDITSCNEDQLENCPASHTKKLRMISEKDSEVSVEEVFSYESVRKENEGMDLTSQDNEIIDIDTSSWDTEEEDENDSKKRRKDLNSQEDKKLPQGIQPKGFKENMPSNQNELTSLTLEKESPEEDLCLANENPVKRRIYKPTYVRNLKHPQTVEEFDEFIAKWRENLQCVICPYSCSKFSLLLQHFQLEHPLEQCYIMCCQLKLYHRYEIESHILYHQQPEAFKCEICFKLFASRPSLREHLAKHHSDKPQEAKTFKCPHCQSQFMHKSSLNEHVNYFCNKQEKQIERQHKCDKCERSYSSLKVLKRHYNKSHQDLSSQVVKKFKCDICDKTYDLRRDLQDHMSSIHKGEPAVVCSLCSKSYAHKSTLHAHLMKEHRPQYEEMKRQKEQLRHIKKTFACATCQNVYQTRLALLAHQSVHTGQLRYRCKFCTNAYKYSSNLSAHVKRAHKEQVTNRSKEVKTAEGDQGGETVKLEKEEE
uniref:Uncharacterized protein n=1 Tax=Stomoxys calcitrans TaxID=35570 RepID=A0A1I8P2Z5_STOCA